VKTIDPRELAQITGGIDWSSIGRAIKPYLPPHGPTIPLGPFYPPKPTDPRIA
jgi:hypothetical protein